MGKNRVIHSIGKVIGNVVMHKLLLEHTNKPESKPHLANEIKEYSIDAFEKSQEFNWNETDKKEIIQKAKERINALSKIYPDITFSKEDADKLILETMDEMMI